MIIKNIFAIIGVIATLIGIITGGQQIYDIYFSVPNLPIFNDWIYITSSIDNYENNQKFIGFLDKNSGKIVYLSLSADSSFYSSKYEEPLGSYRIENGISEFEIPFSNDTSNTLKIYLKNNRKLVDTHNGPGTLYNHVRGAFDIEREYITINYSIYHLRERDIPYEEEIKIKNIVEAEDTKRQEEFNEWYDKIP